MVMGMVHLDHMVGVDVGVAEAHMVVAGVTGRTRIVVHRNGVLRMATMGDGGAFLEPKYRIHQVGMLSLIAGEAVEVVAVVGVTGDREMVLVLVLVLVLEVGVEMVQVIQDGVVARRVHRVMMTEVVEVGDQMFYYRSRNRMQFRVAGDRACNCCFVGDSKHHIFPIAFVMSQLLVYGVVYLLWCCG